MSAAMASGGTSIFLPAYYIPLFFQFTRGDSALESGVRLLPFIMLLIFAVIISGGLMAKFGHYMPWYTAGGALVLVGSALMVTVDASTSAAQIYGYTVVIGFGAGLFSPNRPLPWYRLSPLPPWSVLVLASSHVRR